MEYFVLQDPKPREPNSYYYHIPGLKNSMGGKMDQMPPTQVSIQSGTLEWIIPNNQFNQSWVSQHYSHLSILHAGDELEFISQNKMANMPPPLEMDKALSITPAPPVKTQDKSIGAQVAAQGGNDLKHTDSNPELEAALAIVAKHTTEKAAAEAMTPPVIEAAPTNLVPNVLDSPIIAPPSGNGMDNLPMPKAVDGPGSIDESSTPELKLSPKKVGQLKIATAKKLTELGISVPKNSSLVTLEALLEQETSKVS
jgi:hypothetical protein